MGRTLEVMEIVKTDPSRTEELFELYFQEDEWVKLRSSNALKRLWREDNDNIKPFVNKWVEKASAIDQPSVQWTFAQMIEECTELLTTTQLAKAVERVKNYLIESQDWIVLNSSISSLTKFALEDAELRAWLVPHLEELTKEDRASVAKRATKALEKLS